jgi:hypothetical protein
VDEFSKAMIAAAVGGGLTILGGIITKVLDFWFAILQEKRGFVKSRREKAWAEIEELKNQIGAIYELSINWDGYRATLPDFAAFFAKEHEIIGRLNKYPKIAATARDTTHFCKVVVKGGDSTSKKELAEKYQAFIQACDKYIERLA